MSKFNNGNDVFQEIERIIKERKEAGLKSKVVILGSYVNHLFHETFRKFYKVRSFEQILKINACELELELYVVRSNSVSGVHDVKTDCRIEVYG